MSYKYLFLRILVHFSFFGYPLRVYLDVYSPEMQEDKRFSSEGTLRITCKKYRYPVLLPPTVGDSDPPDPWKGAWHIQV